MREQSMFCDLKKVLSLFLCVFAFSVICSQNLQAQSVTFEPDDMQQPSNDNPDSNFLGVDESIPDELSLPSELPAPKALPENPVGATLDLNTPQPVSDNLPLIGPNAPKTNMEADGTKEESAVLPLTGPNAGAPLTGPNANMPLTGPNAGAPLTGPNANMPLTGPNAGAPLTGPNANMPLTGPNANQPDKGVSVDMPDVENLGEGLLDQIDNKLFSQMSDLEKQTALLTLELRREKIKNEIAAIKAQRQKAIEEEENKKAEKEKKRIEWEKEQEAKVLREQQAVLEAQTKLEKIRQAKILNAYKDFMLKEKQAWVKNNAKLYEQIKNVEDNRKILIDGMKNKMTHIASLADKAQKDALIAKENYQREVKNLQTQISILKSRLDALQAEQNAEKENPFAQAEITVTEAKEDLPKLAEEYAIMEVRGQGEDLIAKLINKNGDSFMVREGTILQSGHQIDEITQTYVRADINGIKDYLYFAAGGILEKEPSKSDISGKSQDNKDKNKDNPDAKLRDTTMVNKGVPSLGSSMFVR